MSTLTDITDLAVAGYLKRSKQVAIDGGIEPISPLVYVEIAKMIQQEEAAISAVRESIGDEQFKKSMERPKKIIAIDIRAEEPEIKTEGTAFVRIPAYFAEFLKDCQAKHGVLGFSYDFDSLNFGVLLGAKKEEEK